MHLSLHLTAPDARPAVVADACTLLDQEVARASGLSGMAIRTAYRVLTGIRPGMVRGAVDGLLDPFADQLDPFYQQHLATGAPLSDILTAQRTSMAEALLSITDDRAERTSQVTLRRAYQRVRGSARGYVEAAAPGIAALIDAHTPRLDEPPDERHTRRPGRGSAQDQAGARPSVWQPEHGAREAESSRAHGCGRAVRMAASYAAATQPATSSSRSAMVAHLEVVHPSTGVGLHGLLPARAVELVPQSEGQHHRRLAGAPATYPEARSRRSRSGAGTRPASR